MQIYQGQINLCLSYFSSRYSSDTVQIVLLVALYNFVTVKRQRGVRIVIIVMNRKCLLDGALEIADCSRKCECANSVYGLSLISTKAQSLLLALTVHTVALLPFLTTDCTSLRHNTAWVFHFPQVLHILFHLLENNNNNIYLMTSNLVIYFYFFQ